MISKSESAHSTPRYHGSGSDRAKLAVPLRLQPEPGPDQLVILQQQGKPDGEQKRRDDANEHSRIAGSAEALHFDRLALRGRGGSSIWRTDATWHEVNAAKRASRNRIAGRCRSDPALAPGTFL